MPVLALRRAAAIALALALAACDASVPGTSPAVAPTVVALEGRPAADYIFAFDPLAPGAAFHGTLALADGASADARTVAGPDGFALDLALDRVAPDSVVVDYLAGGEPVAPSVTYAEGGPYAAGLGEDEPTSFHYERIGDIIHIRKDYDRSLVRGAGAARTAPGTAFLTVGGARVWVTDVRFTLHGVEAAPAASVTFRGGVGFAFAPEAP